MPVLGWWLVVLEEEEKEMCAILSKNPKRDLKADFVLNTEIYFDNFPEKRALFFKSFLNAKCTRQMYALFKDLLGKEEKILPKCENKEILATDFN